VLINAIRSHDIAKASSLISSGGVNLNDEPLPLHCAAQHGGVEIMTMLLDAGADINAFDEYHNSACHVAIFYRRFYALKLLVERGASLDVVDCNGHSLLENVARARYGNDEPFAILLLDAGAALNCLSPPLLMALVTSVAMFNRLMARGVNVTAMLDKSGATFCHYVALGVKREDDFRCLVNLCGNDAVDAVNINGKTTLHFGSQSDTDLAVRVLVELGTEIDRQDSHGWTAFDHCHSLANILTCRIASCTGGLTFSWSPTTARQRATTPRVGECLPHCALLSRQEAILISSTTMVKLLE
jgi:ankyrin repeat protein